MLPRQLPVSRVPDSRDAPPLRWGILGIGWIAERFVASLHRHTRQVVYAVGSRSLGTAQAFARDHRVLTAHASYADLVGDPGVDVVYVATPHTFHLPQALLAISAGKHVVVEKPLGLDAAQAEQVRDAAAAAGVFCMEAMWSLFLPKFDVLRRLLDDGAIGEPRTVVADLGEWFEAGHRILRPDLAGGPMLDLGTYPVTLATWVLGAPDDVVALGTDAPSGVSAQVGAVLRSRPGALAVLHTTLQAETPTAATIAGTDGEIVLDGPFYHPGRFVVRDRAGRELVHDETPVGHDALHFEAAEAARCITGGLLESPRRTLAATVTTLRAMDAIRAAAGIHFAAARPAPPLSPQSPPSPPPRAVP